MTIQKHILVGITGASGAVFGIELLRALQTLDTVTTHVVLTKAAHITIAQETDYSPKEVAAMADQSYAIGDIAAGPASGSFLADAMIVAPCSMHSLAEMALGLSSNLLTRMADVTLKERRPLLLLPRETPLHAVHLQHMLNLAQMGAVIAPPVPAFYNRPETIEDIVQHTVGRVLDLLQLPSKVNRWEGVR